MKRSILVHLPSLGSRKELHGFIWIQNDKQLKAISLAEVGAGGGGRGDNPFSKPYRYVLPQSVWFLRRCGLKTGIDFAHFGLESGMVFEGTKEVYAV